MFSEFFHLPDRRKNANFRSNPFKNTKNWIAVKSSPRKCIYFHETLPNCSFPWHSFEKRHLSKIEIFGPPTKNFDLSKFLGILILFSTYIFRSGTDKSILTINHLLELGKYCSTIYEKILLLAVFPRCKISNSCPQNTENYIIVTSLQRWS